jgi:DNA-binding NarL/FixJ family response regulator
MSTHIKGGYTNQPPPGQDNVNILLIGSKSSDADNIKRELGIITGLSYTAWYCADAEDAMDFIAERDLPIELIFLDLSLFNADYPKERFLQIKKNIPNIPIIVLTDRTDYDLIHFVMEAGAAENVSQWQIRSDPDRLRNIVESCCSRDRISKKTERDNVIALKDAQDKGDADLRNAHDESASLLKETQDNDAHVLKIMVDDNAQLRRDLFKSSTDLLEARHRGTLMVQELHDKSDDVLKHSQDKASASLQAANDENAQLNRDLFKSRTDLEDSSRKSDAILKYAQDKGAVDLKRAKDENDILRKDNDYVRGWLSGDYSVPPKNND